MTISAGFTCIDGILICADMRPTNEDNTAGQKIQRGTVPGLCEYIITGCGTGSTMLKAADMLQEALSASRHLIECQSGATKKAIFNEIFRRRLKEIHSHIAASIDSNDLHEKYLQWIIAVNSLDSGPRLLYIPESGEVESIEDGGVMLGYGAAIAYGFCRILWSAPLPINQMRVLATFALYEAREPTRLWSKWCDSSYLVTPEAFGTSTYDDAYLATLVEEAMRFVLLRCRAKNVLQEDLEDGLRAVMRMSQGIELRTQGNQVERSIIMETMPNG